MTVIATHVVRYDRNEEVIIRILPRLQLQITVFARRTYILTGDVAMVLYLIIFIGKLFFTKLACCGAHVGLTFLLGEFSHEDIMLKDGIYFLLFTSNVLKKLVHDIWSTVNKSLLTVVLLHG